MKFSLEEVVQKYFDDHADMSDVGDCSSRINLILNTETKSHPSLKMMTASYSTTLFITFAKINSPKSSGKNIVLTKMIVTIIVQRS